VGGGYLDGDRYRLNVNLEDNAQVTLTSQGATKIYKTPNDHVEYSTIFFKIKRIMLEKFSVFIGNNRICYKFHIRLI
jgi:urease accessory protein